MAGWAAQSASMLARCVKTFNTHVVVYTPQGGSPATINAVVDAGVVPEGFPAGSGTYTLIGFAQSAVSPIPKTGDAATVDGVPHVAVHVEVDSEGRAHVLLRAA